LANFQEDIISEEIALLEHLKNFDISCVLLEFNQKLYVKRINDVLFVWEVLVDREAMVKKWLLERV